MSEKRPDWDEYFMGMAEMASTRATCDRKRVGAILVRGLDPIKTGYNGNLSKMPHCGEVGHEMENGHCVGPVHAEANAILRAAKHGVATDGATLYTTASPCWPCFQMAVAAGIRRIVYKEFYRDKKSLEVASKLGIEMVQVGVQPPQTNVPSKI